MITLTVDEIETSKPKEPEKALEDEFKDLHLNLLVLEVPAHDPMHNAILDKYVKSLKLGENGSTYVQSKISKRIKDPALFILSCRLGDSKPFDTLSNLGSRVNLIAMSLYKKLKIRLLEVEDFGRFCVLDMEKDPMCPLLVGIGFLVIASAIIDCKKSKIVVGEGHTRPFFRVKENDFINTNAHGEWEIARDVELNPFKDVLVFRKMVEFLEDIPDYLNGNKWEMEDMFDDDWCWKNSPKKEMACGKLR
nr:hypothetical protein [Tanacetum cinerariifolium]